MKSILYFVLHGPNESHLHNVEIFKKLKDAKAFAATLDSHWKLQRQEYAGEFATGVDVSVKVLRASKPELMEQVS